MKIIDREWIRDHTDMYLGTIQVDAKELLFLLDVIDKLQDRVRFYVGGEAMARLKYNDLKKSIE